MLVLHALTANSREGPLRDPATVINTSGTHSFTCDAGGDAGNNIGNACDTRDVFAKISADRIRIFTRGAGGSCNRTAALQPRGAVCLHRAPANLGGLE